MPAQTEQEIKAAKKMYKGDVAILVGFQIVLILLLAIMLFVTFTLTNTAALTTIDPATKLPVTTNPSIVTVFEIVSSIVLILASSAAVISVVTHMKRNHLTICHDDLEQTRAIKQAIADGVDLFGGE